jgi:transcriptional regulator with XRE-family HTH domain
MTKAQLDRRLANYLRTHRRNVGLTLRDVGNILGYADEVAVSRHERFLTMPSLVVALGYEIVYRVPVSEIFAGVREEVEEGIEKKLAEMEERLGQRSSRDRGATATAQKLMWLSERRSSDEEAFQ